MIDKVTKVYEQGKADGLLLIHSIQKDVMKHTNSPQSDGYLAHSYFWQISNIQDRGQKKYGQKNLDAECRVVLNFHNIPINLRLDQLVNRLLPWQKYLYGNHLKAFGT